MINASNGGYDAVAKQFVSDGVDLITWFTDIGGGLRFTQAMDNAGYKGRWVVFSIGYDPRYSTQFGGSGGQVNGAPVVSNYLPFESNSAEIQTVRTTVNRYFPGTVLNSVMVQGWTGARVFATAWRSPPTATPTRGCSSTPSAPRPRSTSAAWRRRSTSTWAPITPGTGCTGGWAIAASSSW
jgi:hypothetical protein